MHSAFLTRSVKLEFEGSFWAGPQNKIIALQLRLRCCNAIWVSHLASFPTTVLTVSGSRVKACMPNLSRSHRHPEDRLVLRHGYYSKNRRFVKGASKTIFEQIGSVAKHKGCLQRQCRFSPRSLRSLGMTDQAISRVSCLPPKIWKCRCCTV